jgi:hypothetical protein
VPFGYAAAAIGTIGAAEIGSQATKKASDQQVSQEQQALGLQQKLLDTTTQNIDPYVKSGQAALPQLNALLGLTPGSAGPVASNPILQMLGIGGPGPMGSIDPSKFIGSPGYNYQLEQTNDAVTNKLNATGGGLGGNALMALQKNASGLANQNWGQYLGDTASAWQSLLSAIGGQAGQGLTAANTLMGGGQNNINAQSGILGNIGNSQSTGTMGQANILSGAINSLINGGNSAGLSGGVGLWNTLNNSLYGQGGGSIFSSAPGSIPGGGTGMIGTTPEGGGALYGNAA